MTPLEVEYRVEPTALLLHATDLGESLNAIAKEGWRLVNIYQGLLIFERAIQTQEQKDAL